MFFIIGAVVVTISVIGGYAANGGHLGVLWQPFEFIIIIGADIMPLFGANADGRRRRLGA